MDVRGKLVELIGSTEYGDGSLVGNNFQKGFIEKIASHLIAHGATVQEWHPVSEPPNDPGEYAVMIVDGAVATSLYYSKRYNGWYDVSDDEYELPYPVTHWQPLPPCAGRGMIMKCTECPDYRKCSRTNDLRKKRGKCAKAKDKHVPTNADRIRSMSDEELAEHLYYGFDIRFCDSNAECEAMLNTDEGIPEEKCKACALEWFKQPAAEESPLKKEAIKNEKTTAYTA